MPVRKRARLFTSSAFCRARRISSIGRRRNERRDISDCIVEGDRRHGGRRSIRLLDHYCLYARDAGERFLDDRGASSHVALSTFRTMVLSAAWATKGESMTISAVAARIRRNIDFLLQVKRSVREQRRQFREAECRNNNEHSSRPKPDLCDADSSWVWRSRSLRRRQLLRLPVNEINP